MKNNDVYILEDRGLLYINGEDTENFLQNIITNDIHKVSEKKSCFGALLTPQGKYHFDFIISKHKSGYLLDCEKKNIDQLYGQLNLYKLRSKIEILNLSNEFVVVVLSREKFLSLDNTKDLEGYTAKFLEDSIFLDPRFKNLGARLIINLEKLHLSLKKLDLKIANVKDYYKLSHELGVAQIDTQNLQNKIFGIECNFIEMNGIDLKKGCYVGQENTSRINLKNKLSKRLMPIKIINGKVNEGDKILNNNNEIGKVLIDNEYPFGVIKFLNNKLDSKTEYKSENSTLKIISQKWIK